MKAVLLGATRGMGRALARKLASQGHQLFILGRDPEDALASARDLKERAGGNQDVGSAHCDLEDPSSFGAALDAADQALAEFDTVVVSAGLFGTQERLEQDLDLARRVAVVNYAHTVLFCEHVRRRLLQRGGGTLCVFSSVAGDRGRRPVALYGSGKAGLSHYLESLDHRHARDGLRVITVKPGFVRTSMTDGLPEPPFAGEPEQVAEDVARALSRGTPVVYTPRIWGLVMLIIRHLPRFIMRRVGF